MRISAVTVYRVDLPVAGAAYTFAKGKRLTQVDTTVARVDTDAGLSGWGETCPLGAAIFHPIRKAFVPASASSVHNCSAWIPPESAGTGSCYP